MSFFTSRKKSSPPLHHLIHDDWVVVDCFQLCWLLVLIGLLWLVEANKKSIYDRYGKEGLTGSSGGRGECVTTVFCALKKEILTATEGNCSVSTTLSIGLNLNMAIEFCSWKQLHFVKPVNYGYKLLMLAWGVLSWEISLKSLGNALFPHCNSLVVMYEISWSVHFKEKFRIMIGRRRKRTILNQ